MIKAPDYVLQVKAYVPGKPAEELERELGIKGSIKLASNENPLGPSKLAIEAIANCTAGLNRYPDGGGFYLRQKLSQVLGVNQDCFILGNGSNELLDIAVRTFMGPGDEAVMARPSFVVYASSVRIQGGIPVEVPLTGDFRHDLDAMAKAVTPKTRMLFIANPNNPTGTINTEAELDGLFASIPPEILVVMDEAYYEYVTAPEYARSMRHFLAKKNILILRTFSKIYGLAGLRIGYGISHPGILDQMDRVRPPFNTGAISQAAAMAALDDVGHVEMSRKINNQGKEFLYGELSALGLEYIPTEANFIFLPVENAASLYEKLLRDGVIIRPMGPGAVRITIGTPEENARLIETLKKILDIKGLIIE